MILSHIIELVAICAKKGIKNVILSPGSRCAPLTLAFARHPDIHTRTISDERSAAFIALGMAQQLEEPVALVCTSGSAALNYFPAIAEAYFQKFLCSSSLLIDPMNGLINTTAKQYSKREFMETM
ncbi:thiamine pyrophosphate-binding protein [Algoriphagus halophilus]|uniref:thiamine pyrophosphate-binding protein n=1 Tax=Algoriphagus halophilus TaxID=226505 RepID=UPI00358F4334